VTQHPAGQHHGRAVGDQPHALGRNPPLFSHHPPGVSDDIARDLVALVGGLAQDGRHADQLGRPRGDRGA
jgi:hypothetical protein